MGAHTYRVVAPARIATIGGPAPTASAGPPITPQQAAAPSKASTGSNPISDAVAGFLANAENSAQVLLGGALVAVALIMLVSQTSAGGGAGRAAVGGARRAARFIPGVGALV